MDLTELFSQESFESIHRNTGNRIENYISESSDDDSTEIIAESLSSSSVISESIASSGRSIIPDSSDDGNTLFNGSEEIFSLNGNPNVEENYDIETSSEHSDDDIVIESQISDSIIPESNISEIFIEIDVQDDEIIDETVLSDSNNDERSQDIFSNVVPETESFETSKTKTPTNDEIIPESISNDSQNEEDLDDERTPERNGKCEKTILKYIFKLI